MDKPLVSIIVPVYNVEDYLQQCIASLKKQTYDNIEIIIIDDGSTDKSLDIIKSHASDRRIKIKAMENNGVSIARNAGVKLSSGEFIMFVDSDDWLDENTVELSVDRIINTNTDVVFFGYIREFEDKQKKRPLFERDMIFTGSDVEKIHRRLVGPIGTELINPALIDSFGSANMKLFKRSIIVENRCEFVGLEKIGSSEDILFNIDVFNYISSAAYLNQCLYHYRKFNTRSISTVYKPLLAEQRLVFFDLIRDILVSNNLSEDFRLALENRIALSIIGIGLNELSSNKTVREKIDKLRLILSQAEYRTSLANLETKHLPIHWRMFFIFAKNNCPRLLYAMLYAIRIIIKK